MKYLTFTRAALLGVSLATAGCSFNFSTDKGANAANVSTPGANTNAAVPAGDPVAAGGESQSATASALVADLYKQHDAGRSPFSQTKNRALVDKYFAKPLADLIWKDANDSSGEVPVINFDPLYDAQDLEIKNFKIGEAEVKGETVKLPVTFTNYAEKSTIAFSLRSTGGAWKIEDIAYRGGDSLMKLLKSSDVTGGVPTSPGREFEGKYQVGETTCSVKPVKMAFEVKWAKGSGVETFFFKEGNTFESDEKGGPNRFEFDDENYNTGTFYRADGKTFAVKRAR